MLLLGKKTDKSSWGMDKVHGKNWPNSAQVEGLTRQQRFCRKKTYSPIGTRSNWSQPEPKMGSSKKN